MLDHATDKCQVNTHWDIYVNRTCASAVGLLRVWDKPGSFTLIVHVWCFSDAGLYAQLLNDQSGQNGSRPWDIGQWFWDSRTLGLKFFRSKSREPTARPRRRESPWAAQVKQTHTTHAHKQNNAYNHINNHSFNHTHLHKTTPLAAQVEFLVMKAMCANLIKGQIDEAAQHLSLRHVAECYFNAEIHKQRACRLLQTFTSTLN